MADLADLHNLVEPQERGSDFAAFHPVTGELMPDVVFTIAGPDSDVQRKARQRMNDELLMLRRRPTAEEQERLTTEMLARCVVGWRVKQDGVDLPFNFTSVLRVLTRLPFLREQVDIFAASRSPYFPQPAPADEPALSEVL
jgi:hypothetical protein